MTDTTAKIPAINAELTIGTLADPATGLMLPDGLHLTFANGSTLLVKVEKLPANIIAQAIVHGLKQKLVDAAAISRNPETGRSATVDDKFLAVREVYDRLHSGEWNKRRESGEGGGTGGLLFAALVRLYAGRKSDDEIRAFLAGKTDKEQAALRASSRVAPIIQAIKDERAAKRGLPDGDDLLAGLDE